MYCFSECHFVYQNNQYHYIYNDTDIRMISVVRKHSKSQHNGICHDAALLKVILTFVKLSFRDKILMTLAANGQTK